MAAGIELTLRRSQRRLPVWGLVLLATFANFFTAARGFAQQTPFSSADQQSFQRAMTAMNGGDAATAAALLQELHTRYPDRFEINESLGLIHAAEHDVLGALPLFTAAAAEQPGSDAAAANLGIAYLKLGRSVDAARWLERAMRLNPANVAAGEALGQAWMQLQQPRKAAAAFREALAVDGNNPTLLYNAALAFFDAGDAASAAPLLARMPGADALPEAQSLYGDVEEKLGAYKEAGQHYVNAARLAPTEANEYVLAVEFLRHWTFQAAAEEFQVGLRQFPGSTRMRLGLGIAYFGNRNYDKAIVVFADLLTADSNNVMYADLLGRTCAVLTEGADPHCTAVVFFAQKHPQNGRIATYAATSILHQPENPTQLALAQQLLAAAIQAEPRLPETHYQRGCLLQREGKWQESVPELESAIRFKPDYSSAHYRLALAYAHTGQHKRAQEEIALQRRYSAQESKDRDERLSQLQTLLVTMK